MKKYKILFWITTSLLFIFEGMIPALTSHTDMAVQGITSLGYPVYFAGTLALFKMAGALALIIPQVPARVKEWAYAGFGFDYIFAFISLTTVFGFNGTSLFPVVTAIILVLSYISYHKVYKK